MVSITKPCQHVSWDQQFSAREMSTQLIHGFPPLEMTTTADNVNNVRGIKAWIRCIPYSLDLTHIRMQFLEFTFFLRTWIIYLEACSSMVKTERCIWTQKSGRYQMRLGYVCWNNPATVKHISLRLVPKCWTIPVVGSSHLCQRNPIVEQN